MSISLKGNSNENKLQPKRAKGNLITDRKLFEEGCNRTSLCNITTAESICEQHISGKEKRWGKRPVISVMIPTQAIEFLAMEVDLKTAISLSQEKVH